MKLFRFMSVGELTRLLTEPTIKNNTHHRGRTNSVGFCFFPLDQDRPETAFRYMVGVADMDICVIFEVSDEILAKMKKGYGIYASYKKGSKFGDTQKLVEYSITEYNNKDFVPIGVCFNCPHYYYNELDWKWE